MPITSKNELVKEEGQDKEAFTISFTNGAKQQLQELQKHFKKDSTEEVVKYAIGVLERLKQIDENKTPHE